MPGVAQQSTALKPAGETRPNIILISVDTLRADRLRSNSPSAEATPNIDKLLHGGTSFSQETSMVPLTLPSHVSMLTSTYPFVSGVEDNGERLAAGAVTLAGTLRSHGYQTAAFLGSFVLDRRFGLDQGFDTYDSPTVSLNSDSSDPGDIKRKGEAVADAGEAWLSTHSDRPFFLFLHLYDLHTPYNLSAEEEAKYGKGYNGELRYIDHVIGGFWDYLSAHGLVNKSLIVFTSDHGEGLGDHGETTHGFFIYQSTLHVPLIIHWPAGKAPMAERVDTPATLLDLSPTILDAVRLPVPQAMQGASMLSPGGQPRDVFSESLYPQRHFGSSALASLAERALQVHRGSEAGVLRSRPGSRRVDESLPEQDLRRVGVSRAVDAAAEGLQGPQPGGVERAQSGSDRASARARIPYRNQLSPEGGGERGRSKRQNRRLRRIRAGHLPGFGWSSGRIKLSLKAILARDPDLADVRLTLGLNEQRMGKDAEALDQFRAVLAAEPTSAIAHLDAGLSYYNLRQYDPADKELNAALAISPGYAKAEIWLRRRWRRRASLTRPLRSSTSSRGQSQ